MVKFSIFLPTYNRQSLVVSTIASLIAQSYRTFEVLLYDNGSHPPVREIAEGLRDGRFRYRRYDENQDVNDLAEDAIDRMSGTHFLFLADDDVLVPAALEVAEGLLRAPEVEILHTGFTRFSHRERRCDLGKAELERFTGRLEVFDAREMALKYIGDWGIGPRGHHEAPRASHSSGIFLSKRLVDRTRRRQGELFIKPFGDVGYVGALLNTDRCHHVDLPLAVIGEAPVREMNGALPGQRLKWIKDVAHLEHSPLKAASFVNMGADAHLKVISRNGLGGSGDFRLRPSFYRRHLRQVLSDSPWTSRTLRDVLEAVPHAIASVFHRPTLGRLAPGRLVRKARSSSPRAERAEPPRSMSFEDINRFAEWVQARYVDPIRGEAAHRQAARATGGSSP